jgi:hypothetical protein
MHFFQLGIDLLMRSTIWSGTKFTSSGQPLHEAKAPLSEWVA